MGKDGERECATGAGRRLPGSVKHGWQVVLSAIQLPSP